MYQRMALAEQIPAISVGYDLGNRVVNPRSDIEVLLRPWILTVRLAKWSWAWSWIPGRAGSR